MSYFPNFEKIKYEGTSSNNPFAFRHYKAEEMVMGKSMKDHLRFCSAYWHTMTQDGSDPFGGPINIRTWMADDPMQTAKNRVDAFFELLDKLGIPFFAFHDVDIVSGGNENLKELFGNMEVITDIMQEKMAETGTKMLWNTANMFSAPIFVHGASTSPLADVFAHSAALVKHGIDISKKLKGENYVFWGGREGYETLLNTNLKLEQDNMARLFHMAIDYSEKIGHKVTFLIEPKPMEPMKHQYDFDVATAMAFLQKYDLDKHFKFNIEANHATLAGHTFNHELAVARAYGALGSIDANQGDWLLGWDTDEFPTDVYETTLAMYEIVDNGGIAPGGINFDARVRRTSFEMDDLAIAHIVGMDTFARGLKAAAKLKEEKFFDNILDQRYASYKTGIGKSIVDGKETLESLSEYAIKKNGNIEVKSARSEYIKSLLNDYIY